MRQCASGISINGLVILSETPLPWNPEHTNPPGGLPKYYRDNVIGGPGSFVLEAKDFNSFGEAIVKKMIAEIAGVRPSDRHIHRLSGHFDRASECPLSGKADMPFCAANVCF